VVRSRVLVDPLVSTGFGMTAESTCRRIAVSGEPPQRRPVADEPGVPERIDKSSLSVDAPRRVMVPDAAAIAYGPLLQRPGDESVRILAAHLHPHRRGAEHRRALPAVRGRLADEEWRAPAISIPATDPRLPSSVAPRARIYQATAAGASGTASITEMREPRVPGTMIVSYRLRRMEERSPAAASIAGAVKPDMPTMSPIARDRPAGFTASRRSPG